MSNTVNCSSPLRFVLELMYSSGLPMTLRLYRCLETNWVMKPLFPLDLGSRQMVLQVKLLHD